LNHSQRRLAALAILAHDWPRLQRASGKSSVQAARNSFQTLDHPFWNFHYTLTSKAAPRKMALIGEARVADILANVLFPFWLAHDLDPSASRATRRISDHFPSLISKTLKPEMFRSAQHDSEEKARTK